MDKENEATLVRSAQEGNEQALIALYQYYLTPIYRYVYSKVGNQSETEDITSEVFLKVVRNLQNFRGESSFKNWLYQIAKNTIADYWRRHYRNYTVSMEEIMEINLVSQSNPAQEDMEKELTEKESRVKKILDLLPDNYRHVLELRFLKNYSIKDIAEALDITISNTKVLQYRALKKAFELSKNI